MDAFATFLGCLPRIKGGGRCSAGWHVAKQLADGVLVAWCISEAFAVVHLPWVLL